MAVPKKKRYKQVVKSRRSALKIDKILKKNLTITKFNNYANILNDYKNITYCESCNSNDFSNKLCSSCYVFYFLNFYDRKRRIKNTKSKFRVRLKNKEFSKNYYYELSKTLFSSSRP